MRYIEMNLVRARMVDNPGAYPWSSYQMNALGKEDLFISPHNEHLALVTTLEDTQAAYQSLFNNAIPNEILEDIRQATNKAWILGSESFTKIIEHILFRQGKAVAKGGDRKSAQYKNKMKINRV